MRFLVPYLATHALRPVQRFFPDLLWQVDAEAKTAYLTFDDGPTEELTDDLLGAKRAVLLQAPGGLERVDGHGRVLQSESAVQ